MDKYEFNIKVEQMKKQAKIGDYETAMKIADGIDWRRVQNVSLLSLVSEIYEKNREISEAKEILLLAFEKAPIGKGLLYKLTKLALKEGSVEEAEAYYREFYDLDPEDTRQYILRYLILKAKGASIDQLIHSLETYNHAELDEKWMYELAELYHEAGRSADCVRMCDNIMLMFGLGKYVDKAIELKTEKEGKPLTQYQQSLIDNRDKYEENLKKVEQEYGTAITDESDEDYGEEEDLPVQKPSAAAPAPKHETADFSEPEELPEDDADGKKPPMDPMDAEIEAHLRELDEERKLARAVSGMKTGGVTAEDEAGQTKIFRGPLLPHTPEEPVYAEGRRNISIEEEDAPLTETADGAAETASGPVPKPEDKTGNAAGDVTPAENGTSSETAPVAASETASSETVPEKKETATDTAAETEGEPEETVPEKKKTPGSFNCFIIGRTAEEGYNAAKDKIREIHAATGISNGVVKIRAQKLNEKGVLASEEKIQGRDLIIEEAGDLTEKSISELLTMVSHDGGKRTVLLIDNPLQVKKTVAAHPALSNIFGTEQLHEEEKKPEEEMIPEEKPQPEPVKKNVTGKPAEDILKKAVEKREPVPDEPQEDPAYAEEELNIEEFVQYASDYAKKIDCTITGKSMLALYERVEIMEEDSIKLTRKNAETLIEEAADKAEKPPLMKRIGGMFSPKYDHDGLLILKEEDFI